jgi:uncharacterized protein
MNEKIPSINQNQETPAKGKIDKVRRIDRQETEETFLKALLHHSLSCSIAIETGDFPLLHVAFFVYDEQNNDIIFHFSKYGYGAQHIIDDKKVTVSVYKYGKLYTAEKAVDFGCEYQSAIIYGKIRIVNNEAEKMEAMRFFFQKFFERIPTEEYKPFTVTEANPIYVAKIRIDQWMGKQHLVPEKAKDAFYSMVSPVI